MANAEYLKENQFMALKELFSIAQNKYGRRKLALNILKKNKKNQKECYNQIAFTRKNIALSDTEIDDLLNKKLLEFISRKESKMTLTLKTILMLEYGITNPNVCVDELLNDLNNEFFDKILELAEEKITAREKAFVLAAIGLSAFTDEHGIKVVRENEQYFKIAVDLAAEFIIGLGKDFDDNTISDLWKRNVVGETPVTSEIPRLNSLPLKTEGIYKTERGKGQYLDVLANNKLDESKLTYLLRRLFGDIRPLSFEERKKLVTTLDKIKQNGYKIFKLRTPAFDDLDISRRISKLIMSGA